MEQWKIDMNEAKRKKELKKKYPHIGKIVKYKGEYGVVCFDPDFKIEDINSTSDIKYFDDIYAVYEFIKSNEAINRFKLLKSITIGNNKSVIGSDCVISIVHFYKLKRLKHIYNKEKNKIEVIE